MLSSKKFKKFLKLFVSGAFLLLLTFLPLSSQAAFTSQINYQGKLTGSAGTAVTDGSYSIQFKLYNTATGGSALWSETDTVTTTGGLFSLLLGSTTDLSTINFNQPLYLSLNVNGDGEMTPRKTLGVVTNAFNALKFDGFATSSFLRADITNATGTITNLTMANATTSVFSITGLAHGSYLAINNLGQVIATTTPPLLSSNNIFTGSNTFDGLTATNLMINNGITLGGVTRTSWPSGGGGGTDVNWSYNPLTDKLTPATSTSGLVVNGNITASGLNTLATTTIGNTNTKIQFGVKTIAGVGDVPMMSGSAGASMLTNGVLNEGVFALHEINATAPALYFLNSGLTHMSLIEYATATQALSFSGASGYNFDNSLNVTSGNLTIGGNTRSTFNSSLIVGEDLTVNSNLNVNSITASSSVLNFISATGGYNFDNKVTALNLIADNGGNTLIIGQSGNGNIIGGTSNIVRNSNQMIVQGYSNTASGTQNSIIVGKGNYMSGETGPIGDNDGQVMFSVNSTSTCGDNFVWGGRMDVSGCDDFVIGLAGLAGSQGASGRVTASFAVSILGLNLGLGTSSPQYALVVGSGSTTSGWPNSIQVPYGSICVDNDGWCTPTVPGNIYAVNLVSSHSDLAENYQVGETGLIAGDIVAIDVGGIRKARSAGEIMGIISTAPGVTLGSPDGATTTNQLPVALSGRVPVKVNLDNGEIKIGDKITLSNTAGVGAKALPGDETVGIALSDFNNSSPKDGNGVGSISIFVNLGYERNVENLASVANNLSISADGTLIVKKIQADEVVVEQGVTVKDQATGAYSCIYVENGAIKNKAGECGAPSLPDTTTPASAQSFGEATSTPDNSSSTPSL